MLTELKQQAHELADVLKAMKCRVVFAESCTGGLISAVLAQIPAVSENLCGSAVVYRLDTKSQWLGVTPDVLKHPGPVSAIVARQMAEGVLGKTPEADWSASITGHLGPNAPLDQDGLIYIGVAHRLADQPCRVQVQEHWLGDPMSTGMNSKITLRERRQVHAAGLVMQSLLAALQNHRPV